MYLMSQNRYITQFCHFFKIIKIKISYQFFISRGRLLFIQWDVIMDTHILHKTNHQNYEIFKSLQQLHGQSTSNATLYTLTPWGIRSQLPGRQKFLDTFQSVHVRKFGSINQSQQLVNVHCWTWPGVIVLGTGAGGFGIITKGHGCTRIASSSFSGRSH